MSRRIMAATLRHFGAVALVLALAACVTTQQAQKRQSHADRVHQNAPQWMKGYWQRYLRDARGQFAIMALDKNGNGVGWVYCSSNCNVITSRGEHSVSPLWSAKAIGNCEEVARNHAPATPPRCDIYAIKDEIVWKHPFPWSAAAASRHDTPAVTSAKPKKDGEQCTFMFSWVGSGAVHRGTLTLQQGVGSGRWFSTMEGYHCEGEFRFTAGRSGEWEVDCGNGWITASGQFTETGGAQGGSRGTGVDNRGRLVEFIVDPAGGV